MHISLSIFIIPRDLMRWQGLLGTGRRLVFSSTATSGTSGSIVVNFALALPILLLMIGGALDVSQYLRLKGALHDATDAAALAAAKEVSLSDSRTEGLTAVAQSVVNRFLGAHKSAINGAEPTVSVQLNTNPQEVDVAATIPFKPLFGNTFGLALQPITVRSVARIMGTPNICLLALERHEAGAIQLQLGGQITGSGCAIFSNSNSVSGVNVLLNSRMTAETVCSAGGVIGAHNISPAPYFDCPQFDDPLADRAEPTVGACDHNAVIVALGTRTLTPGVYCGGLTVLALAKVILEPGTYVFTGGPVIVEGLASISGTGVTLFFSDVSAMVLGETSVVRLSASTSGPLAGLLIFGSRQQSELITHTILSRNAQHFVGTVYLPRNTLLIDGSANIGSQSAYTAIVARRVMLLSTPNVVLNSDYSQTDVPVPDGIRGAGQPARLVR
jgi:Flp pilus assembly protein TadG